MAAGRGRTLMIAMFSAGLLVVGGRAGWAADAKKADCPAMAGMPYQIRLSSCTLAKAVATGMARSATFRQLVGRVGDLKGIVYVNARFLVEPDTRRVFYGALQHRIVKAGDYRLLYVTLAPEPGDQPVVILAHELQHAIEVLESRAANDAAVDALFERIGAQADAWAFETGAAVQVQRTVGKELSARHR